MSKSSCEFCSGNILNNKCVICGARVRDIITEEYKPKEVKKQPKQELSLLQKTKNFAKSAARHISNGMPVVDNEEMEKRLKLCISCDRYNSDTKTCSECGCNVEIKAKWALEYCPLKKWDKMEQKTPGGIYLPAKTLPRSGCGGCGGKKT